MEGTGAIGNWEAGDMNMNLRGGRLGVGYSGAPQGTLGLEHEPIQHCARLKRSGQFDSLWVHRKCCWPIFGGITWSNSGRRRAGIASVMEAADIHVGLAFFTRGTDGRDPCMNPCASLEMARFLLVPKHLGQNARFRRQHKLSFRSHSVLWVESNDGSADMGMDSGTLEFEPRAAIIRLYSTPVPRRKNATSQR